MSRPQHLFGLAATALAASIVAPTVSAQPINIDFGATAAVPSPAYAGAALQPGLWNALAGSTIAPQPLLDTTGAITSATLQVEVARPEYSANHPGTTGDDQALYDDCLDLGPLLDKTTLFIDGLTPGFYGIYIYAWSGDSELFRTGVTVIGAHPEASIGGAWPGLHQPGITFAYTTFLASGGPGPDATVLLRTLAGYGSVNGIQLVPIPAPGVASLLLLAAASRARRRA